jgi:hypothetical protein
MEDVGNLRNLFGIWRSTGDPFPPGRLSGPERLAMCSRPGQPIAEEVPPIGGELGEFGGGEPKHPALMAAHIRPLPGSSTGCEPGKDTLEVAQEHCARDITSEIGTSWDLLEIAGIEVDAAGDCPPPSLASILREFGRLL